MTLWSRCLPKTLKSKLLIAFFSIGFFPYLFMLIYSHNLGEKKMIENAFIIQSTQMNQVKTQIETQVNSLAKEIHFLAALDIMNDMIVEDIDKRIEEILTKKEDDLNLEIHFFTLDKQYKVIASSQGKEEKSFKDIGPFKDAKQKNKHYFFKSKSLILFSEIKPSMQNKTTLGYLCVEYFYKNFETFTVNKGGMTSVLLNKKHKVQIGKTYDDTLLHTLGNQAQLSTSNYVLIQETFDGLLSNWSLVYMLKKSVLLKFLDEFIFILWGLLILGFVLIALGSLWISKRIVEPIAKLSKATKSIIETKDYSTQVSLSSDSEIAELTRDFNIMVKKTQKAFEVIEEENKLRLLLSQTEEVSRAKSDFISFMSHELRTPLHTILSAAQYLIGYENLTFEQQTKVATMETSAHYLLGMITDLLDLAQIEAGKVLAKATQTSTEELVYLIEEICMMLGVLAEQKNIEIRIDNHLQSDMNVWVDMALLKQIIINLLSNAIKFTDEGSVIFLLKENNNNLYIEIKDSGIGISEEDMPGLFKDFGQVKVKRNMEQKGSGLGLAISRKLAVLFDAEVSLESLGEGQGSSAIIIMKIAKV